jgi:CubicO group peptidase (beta-lactamase class C family)
MPLVFPSTDWIRDTAESQGLDGKKLDAGLGKMAHAGNIVVIRNGRLVATQGSVGDSGINIYSASKSITALVFARLLQGSKVSYDDLIPGSDHPEKPRASFRQFLSMTSDYGLTPHRPGKHYAYNNKAIRFYGEYLRTTFFPGEDAAGTLKAALLDPIGGQDDVGISPNPKVYGTPWAGGQRISARDLARAGLLVLARGNWGGRQLIPAGFCDALYRNQIPAAASMNTSPGVGETGPNSENNQQHISGNLRGNYSFGWWNNDGGRVGADLPHDIAHASGRGGNYAIVIPAWSVVIAVTNDEPERRPGPEAYVKAVRDALRTV